MASDMKNGTLEINVLFFSVLREKLGRTSQMVTLEPGATGADLIDKLAESNQVIDEYRQVIRLAINTGYAKDSQVLDNGDEVALITPVSGG